LEEAQRRLEPPLRQLDWAKRSHVQISPLVYSDARVAASSDAAR
jgi:hypothetical protein